MAGPLEYTQGRYTDAAQVLERLPGPWRNTATLSAPGASLIKTNRAVDAIPVLKSLTALASGDAVKSFTKTRLLRR